MAVIKSENEHAMSSTGVKKELKQGNTLSTMLSKPVIEIIDKYSLYMGDENKLVAV